MDFGGRKSYRLYAVCVLYQTDVAGEKFLKSITWDGLHDRIHLVFKSSVRISGNPDGARRLMEAREHATVSSLFFSSPTSFCLATLGATLL